MCEKLAPGAVKTSRPKFFSTPIIFKTLHKVNNRPVGENSPHLVTLTVIYILAKQNKGRIRRRSVLKSFGQKNFFFQVKNFPNEISYERSTKTN
jgi:hypothetical protein